MPSTSPANARYDLSALHREWSSFYADLNGAAGADRTAGSGVAQCKAEKLTAGEAGMGAAECKAEKFAADRAGKSAAGKINAKIRRMKAADKEEVLLMMREFYSSSAVSTNGSDEIFENDFKNSIGNCPFLEGFIFYSGSEVLGYAMIAKSFSTEFGKPCIWFEDLYIKPKYRGRHIVPNFIKFIENNYPNSIFRLEAEPENAHAVHVYEKLGFKKLPYMEMKKELS